MSGGTEGAVAPHWTVFERIAAENPSGPALAIGRAHTAELAAGRSQPPDADAHGRGRCHSDADAGIENPADVPSVAGQMSAADCAVDRRGARPRPDVATQDTLKSMALSRAASALSLGVALCEIDPLALSDCDVGVRHQLWSGRASCSAGIELLGHEVIVLGMSPHWRGALAIDHAVMRDAQRTADAMAGAAKRPAAIGG